MSVGTRKNPAMNEPSPDFQNAPLTEAEKQSALFAQLVMQSASMALMLMGRAPNPMTGQTETDLDGARLFIEQLEMLELKTKGNLSAEEQHLLKQNLMNVRMSFVEAVNQAKETVKESTAAPASSAEVPPSAPEDSGKKKFSKSYGEG